VKTRSLARSHDLSPERAPSCSYVDFLTPRSGDSPRPTRDARAPPPDTQRSRTLATSPTRDRRPRVPPLPVVVVVLLPVFLVLSLVVDVVAGTSVVTRVVGSAPHADENELTWRHPARRAALPLATLRSSP